MTSDHLCVAGTTHSQRRTKTCATAALHPAGIENGTQQTRPSATKQRRTGAATVSAPVEVQVSTRKKRGATEDQVIRLHSYSWDSTDCPVS